MFGRTLLKNGFVAGCKPLVASVKHQADSENTASLLLHLSLMFSLMLCLLKGESENNNNILKFYSTYRNRNEKPSEVGLSCPTEL